MEAKGNSFEGIFGGVSYDRLAFLAGLGSGFYRKAVGEVPVQKEFRILDLGCGTGSLGMAMAEKCGGRAFVLGVDISEHQLSHAVRKAELLPGSFNYFNCSMDEQVFPDDYFDLVITSMAFHETTPSVRRRAIAETARVLKEGGRFILVDWSRPRWGILGVIWFPFLFFGDWRDNWNNTYRGLCEERKLSLQEDCYINSLIRRQIFRKFL